MPSVKEIVPNSKKASSFYSSWQRYKIIDEDKFESGSIAEGRNCKKGVPKSSKGKDQHSCI